MSSRYWIVAPFGEEKGDGGHVWFDLKTNRPKEWRSFRSAKKAVTCRSGEIGPQGWKNKYKIYEIREVPFVSRKR